MDTATALTAEYEQLQAKYKELEEARYAQAKYVQKMQKVQEKVSSLYPLFSIKKSRQMDVYIATIGMQEKVIAKLQKIVEDHLKNSKSGQSGDTYIDVYIILLSRCNYC